MADEPVTQPEAETAVEAAPAPSADAAREQRRAERKAKRDAAEALAASRKAFVVTQPIEVEATEGGVVALAAGRIVSLSPVQAAPHATSLREPSELELSGLARNPDII